MARIDRFWAESEAREFEWGQCDCLTWIASFVEAITGQDPAAKFRGTYNTKWGARQVMIRSGGMVALVGSQMRDFPTGERSNGVAIIEESGTRTGAVLVDGVAWLKNDDGLSSIVNPKIIEGWKLCRKR